MMELTRGLLVVTHAVMTDFEIFQRFALAIAIGLLAGVERHWRERYDPDGSRMAGIRTYSLIGMMGGSAAMIDLALLQRFPAVAVPGLVTGLLALPFIIGFAWFSVREAARQGNVSATSFITGPVVYALAAVAIFGETHIAAAGGVALVGILASREALHSFLQKISWLELRSAIVLLGMTFIILPLLPEKPIGPFGGFSPQRIWLLAILLASLSYAGYLAGKFVGATRGELMSGTLAGLVSSTGVTLALARRSATGEAPMGLASGAIAAGAVSLARTGVLLMAVAPALVVPVLPSLLSAALVMGIAAFIVARNAGEGAEGAAQRNPFDLFSIGQVIILLIIASMAAEAALAYFGSRGLLAVGFLSGLADMDAATVTLGGLASGGAQSLGDITSAFMLAVLGNLSFKAAAGLALGASAFSLRLLFASLAAAAAGALAYVLI
jgi:uncharacterized membrane protein (DUF4010 family)